MRRTDWLVLASLVASSVLFLINYISTRSYIIGMIASILYIGSVSTVLGKLVYKRENTMFRPFFGAVTLVVFLALIGTGLIISGSFTETVSLGTLIVMSTCLSLALIIISRKKPTESDEQKASKRVEKRVIAESLLLIAPFVLSVSLAFQMLWIARTGEGVTSVWLTIPPQFVIAYLVGILSLALILFFTNLNTTLKLVLVSIFSFLSHSLFLLVWYPGRYGDPWSHLGEARYIIGTGQPYAYSWILQQHLFLDLVKFRAQYSLVAFFERMFYVDLYWVHVLLIPALWSVFAPLLSYKIAETLAVKKNKTFSFLAALAMLAFPSIVAWGAISVPNSLGFLFFFVSATLLLLWMKQGASRIWLMALFATIASLLAHPQVGIFATGFLLLGTVIGKTSRKILWIASFGLVLASYPLILFFNNAYFTPDRLLQIGNYLTFQSEVFTLLLALALIGLALGTQRGFVDSKATWLFFSFYGAILFEYYLTKYGMSDLPYGPERVLVMADLLLVPLVALGLSALLSFLRKGLAQAKGNTSPNLLSRISFRANTRVIGLFLISLFLSLQATAVLYQAYPLNELVTVQPSFYEQQAIEFIDSDAQNNRYVVLCEPGFASLAIGVLGSDFGYLGGERGTFGYPEFWYPTVKMYEGMTEGPSIGYMKQAMDFASAKVSYFVVSIRNPDFEQVVVRTSAVLPVYERFGDDQLYVYKYPLLPREETGMPVTVQYDNGSSANVTTNYAYIVEAEVNATVTLQGHLSYNITAFPKHWTFLELTVDNGSRSLDASNNVNSFIYVSEIQPAEVVSVKWMFNRFYEDVGWKEDSFKGRDWHTDSRYGGTMMPNILKDGNTLNLAYSFTPGAYWYYYYSTSVGISTNAYRYILVKWRSPSPVAVSSVYLEAGMSYEIVPLSSQSAGWVTTIKELPPDAIVSTVMVGLSNARDTSLSANAALEVDFIMFANRAPE